MGEWLYDALIGAGAFQVVTAVALVVLVAYTVRMEAKDRGEVE